MENQTLFAKDIGAEEWVSGFTLLGVPDDPVGVLCNIIKRIGMEPDGCADIRCYPNSAGKGGEGVQCYQPLTESFAVAGTWTKFGFTRVLVSSCRPYIIAEILKVLEEEIGVCLRFFGPILY